MCRREAVVEKVLALPLLRNDLLDLRYKFGWRNELAQADLGVRLLDKSASSPRGCAIDVTEPRGAR